MFLDVSWQEIFIIVVLGIIILKPEEIPQALNAVTRFIRKCRQWGWRLQKSLQTIIQETEITALQEELEEKMRRDNLAAGTILDYESVEPEAKTSQKSKTTPIKGKKSL